MRHGSLLEYLQGESISIFTTFLLDGQLLDNWHLGLLAAPWLVGQPLAWCLATYLDSQSLGLLAGPLAWWLVSCWPAPGLNSLPFACWLAPLFDGQLLSLAGPWWPATWWVLGLMASSCLVGQPLSLMANLLTWQVLDLMACSLAWWPPHVLWPSPWIDGWPLSLIARLLAWWPSGIFLDRSYRIIIVDIIYQFNIVNDYIYNNYNNLSNELNNSHWSMCLHHCETYSFHIL